MLKKLNKSQKTVIILIFIIAIGAFFRLYNLGSQSFWMDEGYTINAVLSTIENGTKNGAAILDSGKTYSCPLYCSPTAMIAKTFGENAVSYRLLASLMGIIFIIVSYFFTKRFFNSRKIALLSAFFISLSYWQIAWSREARWYTLLEVFFYLALLAFYFFLKEKTLKKKIIAISATIIFTILAIISHSIAYLLPIILLSWYIFDQINLKNQNATKFFKKILYPALATLAIIAFVEFLLGVHFITKSIAGITWSYNLPYYLSFYLRNYWVFIAVGIFGYFNAKGDNKKSLTLLAIPLILYLFCLSFLTKIVHYRYFFHLTPIIYIIASASIINLSEAFKSRFKKYGFILIILGFISGNLLAWPKNFYLLESDNPDQMNRPYYAYTPQPNFNAAYDVVKRNIMPEEIIISSHPHFNKIFLNQPGYWLKYDYLGMDNTVNAINDNKEFYVGAEVINNLEELKTLTRIKHGYIVFDFMATDGRIDPQILNYIRNYSKQIFHDKINIYSQIWVYKF